jgi:hypothetical protein
MDRCPALFSVDMIGAIFRGPQCASLRDEFDVAVQCAQHPDARMHHEVTPSAAPNRHPTAVCHSARSCSALGSFGMWSAASYQFGVLRFTVLTPLTLVPLTESSIHFFFCASFSERLLLVCGFAPGAHRAQMKLSTASLPQFHLVRRVIASEGQRSGQDRSGWDCGSAPGSPCK